MKKSHIEESVGILSTKVPINNIKIYEVFKL